MVVHVGIGNGVGTMVEWYGNMVVGQIMKSTIIITRLVEMKEMADRINSMRDSLADALKKKGYTISVIS